MGINTINRSYWSYKPTWLSRGPHIVGNTVMDSKCDFKHGTCEHHHQKYSKIAIEKTIIKTSN